MFRPKRGLASQAPVIVPSRVNARRIRPLRLPPPGPLRDIRSFFHAVRMGDMHNVRSWLDDRYFQFAACDEAGLDLAMQEGHVEIAELLRQGINTYRIQAEARYIERNRKYQPMHRTTLEFDRAFYYAIVQLEVAFDHQITLDIVGRSALELPYLIALLQPLGGVDLHLNRIHFAFKLKEEGAATIQEKINRILAVLPKLKKHGTADLSLFFPIAEALRAFLHEGKAQPVQIVSSARIIQLNEQPDNKYADYLLYDAAIHLDAEEMLHLLRSGANPNVYFDKHTILWHLLSTGVHHINNLHFNDDDRRHYTANLFTIMKLLLQYGADPMLESNDKTAMEQLINNSENATLAEKHICEKIIHFLTAASTQTIHIYTHPQLATSYFLAPAVLRVNQTLFAQFSRRAYVAASHLRNDSTMDLTLNDGSSLVIESLYGNDARLQPSHAICATLTQFFEQHTELEGTATTKRNYFLNLLRAQPGVTVVDILRHNGVIKGMIISEVIIKTHDTHKMLINHAKLALAELGRYPGLMKALVWMRGFAAYQKYPQHENYTYYEAASARGFALSDILHRAPTVAHFPRAITELVAVAHEGEDVEVDQKNDCVYIKDPLVIKPSGEINDKPCLTLSVLNQETYNTFYARAGYVLSLSFSNDSDNFEAFAKQLAPMLGYQYFNQLLRFYADQPVLEGLMEARVIKPRL